ncbi:MAG: class I SAM-dependent methyltransferase [Candidatus Aminicenantes bacterium]|nr:class I SAM-dependent methyltransferase [Candidatus Aminicenantes bacterium]
MRLAAYVDFLLAYNEKVNLVSKKSTRETVGALISESLLLKEHISTPFVIDAGSGGGLLGIPLALAFPEKKIVLSETVQKKARFLNLVVEELALKNVSVWAGAIQEYMQRQKKTAGSLISRGFPRLDVLAEFVYRQNVKELVLITSPLKINNIQKRMANIEQNSYNIPSRNNLIIFKMENVSRET